MRGIGGDGATSPVAAGVVGATVAVAVVVVVVVRGAEGAVEAVVVVRGAAGAVEVVFSRGKGGARVA